MISRNNLTTLCYLEQNGCYLMLHRTKKEKDINKDKWIGIGGHLEEGESPEECLVREMMEETGVISFVKEGKLTQKAQVRLIRDGIVVYTGSLASLQRGKDDAREVPAGMECGCALERFNDIHPGDIIEAFTIVEIKKSL